MSLGLCLSLWANQLDDCWAGYDLLWPKPTGFHTPWKPKRARWVVRGFEPRHNSTKRPPERGEKTTFQAREVTKKHNILGSPPSGPLRHTNLSRFGPHLGSLLLPDVKLHMFIHKHLVFHRSHCEQICGQSRFGQSGFWPKWVQGLAKVGLGQSRSRPGCPSRSPRPLTPSPGGACGPWVPRLFFFSSFCVCFLFFSFVFFSFFRFFIARFVSWFYFVFMIVRFLFVSFFVWFAYFRFSLHPFFSCFLCFGPCRGCLSTCGLHKVDFSQQRRVRNPCQAFFSFILFCLLRTCLVFRLYFISVFLQMVSPFFVVFFKFPSFLIFSILHFLSFSVFPCFFLLC